MVSRHLCTSTLVMLGSLCATLSEIQRLPVALAARGIQATVRGAPMGQPTFGDELRRLREQHGLSLKKFARLIHYDSGYLSKIERSIKSPSVMLAARCDTALQSDGWLMQLATKDSTTRAQQRHGFSDSTRSQDSMRQLTTASSCNYSDSGMTGENGSTPSTLDPHDDSIFSIFDLDVTLASMEKFTTDQHEGDDDILRREVFESSITAGLAALIPEYHGRRIGMRLIEKLRSRSARMRRLDNFSAAPRPTLCTRRNIIPQ